MARAPTILDVAARAGVSKSLVSLVMRGSPHVSDERRARVLEAARELGYRPNAMARSLVRQRTYVLGVVVSDLRNPFHCELIDVVEAAALAADYRALFTSGSRDAEREGIAIDTLLQLRVDGLILAGPVVDEQRIVEASREVPVVLLTRHTKAEGIDSVANHDFRGATMVVDHLVSLGHRRIAHIDGGRGAGAKRRRLGFLAAMRRHGLADEAVVVSGAYTEDSGAAGVERILAAGPPPTAVFAANDITAVGALHALEDRGLRVPEDVSLVGYDNTAIARLRHIDLTTVDQPKQEMAGHAVRLLVERLDEGRTSTEHIVVDPTLVVRGSTGPVR